MLKLLKLLLTWWHTQTLGTWWMTLRRGGLVGSDSQGNHYYVDKYGDAICGKPRRWVIYNGDVEASRVPPEWHGWLHYTTDTPPSEDAPLMRDWYQPHQQNRTGLSDAHHAHGIADSAGPPRGYIAWNPNDAAASSNRRQKKGEVS